MLKRGIEVKKVILFTNHTDMRKGIDGLVTLVQLRFGLDPLEPGTLFLFCGRRKNKIKALAYEGDGFTLASKKLTAGRYKWPNNPSEAWNLSAEEYDRLLDGFAIESSIKGNCR